MKTALTMLSGLLGTVHLALKPLAYASWSIDALWFVGKGMTALHDLTTLCGFCDSGIVLTKGRVSLTLDTAMLRAGRETPPALKAIWWRRCDHSFVGPQGCARTSNIVVVSCVSACGK